jgi:TolB protein
MREAPVVSARLEEREILDLDIDTTDDEENTPDRRIRPRACGRRSCARRERQAGMIHARLAGIVIAALAVSALIGAGAAHANFKGANGLIVFDSWTGTSQDVGVFDPATGAYKLLTTTPDFSEHAPRWSPDGTKIAYMAHPQFGEDDQRSITDIWVMDADGSDKTQVTSTPLDEEVPAWTADGRILYCGQSGDAGRYDIYLVNADGTGKARLTDSPGLDCWPSAAPSGQRFAFTSLRNGVPELYVMNTNGNGLRRLTTGYISDWSPSGNDIVFSRDAPDLNGVPDGDIDLWTMHIDGTGLRRLTNTPGRVEFFPTWAPDGESIVFGGVVAPGVINIFALDLATGAERLLLADDPPTTWSVAYPSWQPLSRN